MIQYLWDLIYYLCPARTTSSSFVKTALTTILISGTESEMTPRPTIYIPEEENSFMVRKLSERTTRNKKYIFEDSSWIPSKIPPSPQVSIPHTSHPATSV